MTVCIWCTNEKGDLLAQPKIKNVLIAIDEYSGDLERGDQVIVDSDTHICGVFDYLKGTQKHKLHVDGDIALLQKKI